VVPSVDAASGCLDLQRVGALSRRQADRQRLSTAQVSRFFFITGYDCLGDVLLHAPSRLTQTLHVTS
jgi:hypothetical protein